MLDLIFPLCQPCKRFFKAHFLRLNCFPRAFEGFHNKSLLKELLELIQFHNSAQQPPGATSSYLMFHFRSRRESTLSFQGPCYLNMNINLIFTVFLSALLNISILTILNIIGCCFIQINFQVTYRRPIKRSKIYVLNNKQKNIIRLYHLTSIHLFIVAYVMIFLYLTVNILIQSTLQSIPLKALEMRYPIVKFTSFLNLKINCLLHRVLSAWTMAYLNGYFMVNSLLLLLC